MVVAKTTNFQGRVSLSTDLLFYPQQQQPQLSLASSRETGYISDNQSSGFHHNQPFLQHAPRPGGGGYRSDDHETEIF